MLSSLSCGGSSTFHLIHSISGDFQLPKQKLHFLPEPILNIIYKEDWIVPRCFFFSLWTQYKFRTTSSNDDLTICLSKTIISSCYFQPAGVCSDLNLMYQNWSSSVCWWNLKRCLHHCSLKTGRNSACKIKAMMDCGFTTAIISKPDLEAQNTSVGEISGFRVTERSRDTNCLTFALTRAAICCFTRLDG